MQKRNTLALLLGNNKMSNAPSSMQELGTTFRIPAKLGELIIKAITYSPEISWPSMVNRNRKGLLIKRQFTENIFKVGPHTQKPF